MKHRHVIHYGILVAILGIGVAAFYAVRPNTLLQLLAAITTAVSYVLWGIVHHAIEKDLHHRIVIEYMLIGAIAIVLFVTVLGF